VDTDYMVTGIVREINAIMAADGEKLELAPLGE
jgi:hypothetical protein